MEHVLIKYIMFFGHFFCLDAGNIAVNKTKLLGIAMLDLGNGEICKNTNKYRVWQMVKCAVEKGT